MGRGSGPSPRGKLDAKSAGVRRRGGRRTITSNPPARPRTVEPRRWEKPRTCRPSRSRKDIKTVPQFSSGAGAGTRAEVVTVWLQVSRRDTLPLKQSSQVPSGTDDCTHVSFMLRPCVQIMREYIRVSQNDGKLIVGIMQSLAGERRRRRHRRRGSRCKQACQYICDDSLRHE
jgi:hypothetical protein